MEHGSVGAGGHLVDKSPQSSSAWRVLGRGSFDLFIIEVSLLFLFYQGGSWVFNDPRLAGCCLEREVP